ASRVAMARKKKDVALVYAPADDGDGWRVLRQRRGSKAIETGLIRPLRSGRAISGEVVKLEQREESPLLFDVETDDELSTTPAAPEARAAHGPAQVATEDYRRGWDAVWGTRRRGAALN